jgi:succinoglycan biosynthesis transport protein ExoP
MDWRGGPNNLVNGLTGQTPNNNLLGELTLSDFLEIWRRRKWLIILCPIGLLVASAVAAYRLPSIFQAETVILVDSQQVPDRFVPTIITSDIAGRLTTLQQQVLSPTRLKKLVEAEGLYPDPTGKRGEEEVIGSVQKSIVVEAVHAGSGKMAAFRIAYSSKNRTEVARIANHLAQMFIEENLKVRENQTQGTAEFLDDQLKDTKRQLDGTDEQLRTIKSRNILDLPESKPYHMEALSTLRGQLQVVQDKINQDQRDKSILQSMFFAGGPAPTVDIDSQQGDGGGLSADEARIQKLETKLSELRVRYGPAHPDVRKTQNEIDRLRKNVANAPRDSSTPAADAKPAIQTDRMSFRNPVLQAQIDKLDEDIREQTKLLQPLQERMEFHTSKLAQVPVFEQQIARLQQDYEFLKMQYTGLLEKKQGAEMSYALEIRQKAERFVVLDAAQTPLRPAAPNRILITLAGLAGGLVLGVGLAAAAEIKDESVRSETEAARIFGKPVLGGIPRIVSMQEQLARRWRAVGLVAGTLAGSVVLGFLFSFVSKRLF